MVHGLIRALHFLDHENLDMIPPSVASPDDLLQFHTRSYLDVISKCARGTPVSAGTLSRHGLEDDCPVFHGLAAHVRLAGGGSITAARTPHRWRPASRARRVRRRVLLRERRGVVRADPACDPRAGARARR
ncbi:hypothetical protein AMAG_18538 [Allomyces macrogynus ATCC 38327]|uniref:Histone deacetylase domain-containing protein n=1 Tax=Allomyces macrogynus (strain ATCC 38327) TaxID=578462 RepID=A0A0L0SDK3_ALLM3|nr:hypothetical protein AMAG_18538 [Allomyces macrogynus ATCC 38327]|eukprot:KNE60460.1 hypothetical protein AMAG_18538 [Allomyces macrogynus ATCC 38327]